MTNLRQRQSGWEITPGAETGDANKGKAKLAGVGAQLHVSAARNAAAVVSIE